MPYPSVERLELPVLQELVVVGGVEDVRFLYDRLTAYFPQLADEETHAPLNGHLQQWRRLVQRAGRELTLKRELERARGRWTITHQGRRRVVDEDTRFSLKEGSPAETFGSGVFTHAEAQQMLVDIGRVLGHHAEVEYDYYDVVWRVGEGSPRLSHVFEVQRKGNIDAALAKLKRAYDAQRSKPFLIIASERDTNRAERQLGLASAGPFHEIGGVATILSFEQLRRLHRALTSVEDILRQIFDR